MSEKYDEYLICKERGHEPDKNQGAMLNAVWGSVPKHTCRHCGTTYWTTVETTNHEANAPVEPNRDKEV